MCRPLTNYQTNRKPQTLTFYVLQFDLQFRCWFKIYCCCCFFYPGLSSKSSSSSGSHSTSTLPDFYRLARNGWAMWYYSIQRLCQSYLWSVLTWRNFLPNQICDICAVHPWISTGNSPGKRQKYRKLPIRDSVHKFWWRGPAGRPYLWGSA